MSEKEITEFLTHLAVEKRFEQDRFVRTNRAVSDDDCIET
jgi:hypothetical protein